MWTKPRLLTFTLRVLYEQKDRVHGEIYSSLYEIYMSCSLWDWAESPVVHICRFHTKAGIPSETSFPSVTSFPSNCEIGAGRVFDRKLVQNYLSFYVDILDEKAARMDGKLVEIRHEFTFAVFTLRTESRLRRVFRQWRVSLPSVKSGRDVFLTENSISITRRFTRRLDEKAERIDGKLVESLHEFTLDEKLVWQETCLDVFFVF